MKTLAASLIALGLLTGAANAANPDIFADINASAPRSVFTDLADSAPRSPFDQIQDSAPRSYGSGGSGGYFTRLGRTAP